jgi:flagellar biosynthesis/type III secretory pathway protein FliH
MTWSSNPPRAVRRETGSTAAAPAIWSLDELALDTRALHEAAERAAEERGAERGTEASLPDAAEIERALDDAYARGYEEGRRVGETGEAARLRTAVAAVNDALVSLQEHGETWVANAQENVCALAVSVARQIIGVEVAIDKSVVTDLVKRALAEFPVEQALVVRINPSDLTAVSSTIGTASSIDSLGPRKDVQWLADPRIAAGGCLVEGRDRIIDGRVDNALERVYRRLTDTGA